MDKTALYNLNAKEGDWAVIMKVDNDQVWQDVKEGKYQGLSIEGIFSDKNKMDSELENITEEEAIMAINQIKKLFKDAGAVL